MSPKSAAETVGKLPTEAAARTAQLNNIFLFIYSILIGYCRRHFCNHCSDIRFIKKTKYRNDCYVKIRVAAVWKVYCGASN